MKINTVSFCHLVAHFCHQVSERRQAWGWTWVGTSCRQLCDARPSPGADPPPQADSTQVSREHATPPTDVPGWRPVSGCAPTGGGGPPGCGQRRKEAEASSTTPPDAPESSVCARGAVERKDVSSLLHTQTSNIIIHALRFQIEIT